MYKIFRKTLVVSVSFLALTPLIASATWVGPTAAPPGNNVAAPINVGSTDQVKSGGLGVNSLVVFGNSLFGGTTGSNAYLNFGDTSGSSGYGIRDNNGLLEFKNDGDTSGTKNGWYSLQELVYNLCSGGACGGGGGSWATSGNNIYNTNTGYTGIGTTNPIATLDIKGNDNQEDQLVLHSSATETGISLHNTAVGFSWQIGMEGSPASVPLGSFFLQREDTSATDFVLTPNGDVGIGIGSPVGKLDVYTIANQWAGIFRGPYGVYAYGSGYDAYIGYVGYGLYTTWTVGAGGYATASDARLKTALHPLRDDDGLAAILKLKPVTYRWKDAKHDADDGQQMGFLAQDVEKVLPSVVKTGPDTTITLADGSNQTITDTKSIDYSRLTVSLVKAVQEQQAEIETLKAENDTLKMDNTAFKRDIEDLQRAIGATR